MSGAREDLEGLCREFFPDYEVEVEDLGTSEGFYPHITDPNDGNELPFWAVEIVLDCFDAEPSIVR